MNGTFIVYRKLHENVGTFREFLNKWSARYGAGDQHAKDKFASKFVGRWRDGTPIELSPDHPNAEIVKDSNRNANFMFGADLGGSRCPVGAHVRRVNPRDAFGFNGSLVHRQRISRRGMTYGPIALAEDQAVDPRELDATDRGVIFMALNASLARQFEFVQQQWISYGNDAHLGNEKDLLMAHHAPREHFSIQGDTTEKTLLSSVPTSPTLSSYGVANTSSFPASPRSAGWR